MSTRLASNTMINIANTAIGFIIAYAMTPVILHRLGIEQYGLWAFLSIFSVSGYFSLLDFGFQGAAIKFIAEFHARRESQQLESVISATIVFFIVVGIIGGLLLLLFNAVALSGVFNLPTDQLPFIRMLVSIVALSFLVQFPALGFSAILEGLQRYDILRGVTMAVTILTNGAILLWMKGDRGVTFLVWSLVAGGAVMVVSFAVATRRLLPTVRFRLSAVHADTLRRLFSLSSKLFLSKIVGLIFNNTDKILIGVFLYVTVQTDYDIVNKLHIILLSILSIINQAILPAAAAVEASGDAAGLRQLLLRATKYSAALVLPMWLFLILLPNQALTMWVGPSFSHLAPLVVLYASHIVITMLVGVSSTMLVSVNKVSQVLKISIWAAVINLVISTATVRWLGITGLILGTTVAYIGSSLLYIRSVNRIFAISLKDFLKATLRPLLPSSAMVILLLLLVKYSVTRITLLGGMVLVVCLYALFLSTMTRFGLERDERHRAWQWWLRLTKKGALDESPR